MTKRTIMMQWVPSVLFGALLLLPAGSALADGEWEHNDEEDGITLYIRDVDDSSINELKAITIMDCTTEQLFNILIDPNMTPKFIENLTKSEQVGTCGDNCILVYRYVETTLTDVHYVLKMRWSVTEREEGYNEYTIKWRLADEQPEETDDAIVAEGVKGRYKMRVVQDTKTKFTLQTHFHISGPAPFPLINEGMEDGTIDTVKNLRDLCTGTK